MTTLFDPIRLGDIEAPNRILMAPMTRGRATRDHVPTPMMAEYYSQRASAGLIISEATGISRQGLGWPYAPGIWSKEQVTAWRPVLGAVHAAGGRIVCQLWHMGRVSHPDFLDGQPPVSASASTAPGQAFTYKGRQDYVRSRALTLGEMPKLLEDFRHAAANAMEAGFDGVQLHGANGYLIDQFLRDGTNQRHDAYGGGPEQRVRLLLEVTSVLVEAAGAGRVSVRLSPNDDQEGCGDSQPGPLFVAAARGLNRLGIGFLEMRAARPGGDDYAGDGKNDLVPAMRREFLAPIVINGGYRLEDGTAALERGEADAIAYGRPFLANPDLPARLVHGYSLNDANPRTFYTQGAEGYVDYSTAASIGD